MSPGLIEAVAQVIYHAAFRPADDDQAARKVPSPGWCWERTSEVQRDFCRRQARAALGVLAKIDPEELRRLIR